MDSVNENEIDYGECWCENPLEGVLVEIRVKVKDRIVVLQEVPQGVCAECGIKVFKPDTLDRAESLFRRASLPDPPPSPDPDPQPRGRPPGQSGGR